MMEKLKLKLLFVCALVFLMGAGQVLGDWDHGDGHKMHWPQTPKPGGFDVDFHYTQALGDDWQCTETGPVTDIHFWASWKYDDVGTIDAFTVTIYDDDPCGTGGWSEPNTPQWTRNFIAGDFMVRPMQPDLQGWFEPDISWYDPCNHSEWCQVNITDINGPFIQRAGEIYWLVISDVNTPPGTQLGWKETYRNFNDDGVWRVSAADGWEPLENPDSTTMDLAFVITTEPTEPPKHRNLKWSQPPIEWDPTWDIPVYCGWDELSLRDWIDPFWFDCWNCRTQCYGDADCDGYVGPLDLIILNAAMGGIWPNPPYNPCADFNHDGMVDAGDLAQLMAFWQMYPPADCSLRPQSWQMAADDFRCLGTMPITSIHWWGSHLGWEEPNIMPPDPDLPIAWRIGFWSNVNPPASKHCGVLYGAATGVGGGGGPTPSNLYSIDPTTGTAFPIGPIGFDNVTGLSFAPDGTLYASANGDRLYPDGFAHSILLTIDTSTGAGTLVGEIGSSANPTGAGRMPDISFDLNGRLYGNGDRVGGAFVNSLYTINTSTGAGTFIGVTGFGVASGKGMDFAPDGTLYSTPARFAAGDCLATLNPATGVGSCVPGTGSNVPPRVNALDFCGGVLYGSWNNSFDPNWYLVTIDLTTGLPTVIGQTVDGLDAIAFDTFSHPGELLWQIEVPEDRVDVKEVGSDEYPMMPYYDICYQYYLDLEPNEWFWQNKYKTLDRIYWLSIAAVYDPCVEGRQFPWGWKTRPWSWMDDAVRFWVDENPEPGMVLDPERNMIEPIEDPVFYESFDLAFELDTDPNYIKWEQPFTGIRDWPHYEDEKSMAIEVTTTETVTKYIQPPDLSPNGVDVDATTLDDAMWSAQILADDFNCTTTGLITDIHIWGSWYHDEIPDQNAGNVDFHLSIYSDRPAGPDGWSEPNEWLWDWYFMPGEFDVSIEDRDLNEGYYVPCAVPPFYEPNADTICYKYDFYIDPPYAFLQRGSPDNPVVYWLVVEAYPWGATEPVRFGWKTSTDHWNDDAVWTDDFGSWNELRYPAGHPFEGNSIDLAFEITTEEKETELFIDRLAADDWPCDGNEPVSSAVWWGSYIGYRYAACDIYGPWMPLPVPPKYFWLTIWDDVPATQYTKYAQAPDPCGWDICLCNQVADDFNCTETGPITDVHFWISWMDDIVGEVNNWEVEIWSDKPGEPGAGPLWTWNGVGNVTTYHDGTGPQGYFCPCASPNWHWPPNHFNYYKVDIDNIQNPFIQQAGTTYWLVIRGNFIIPCAGWKTSVDHWNSDAVYFDPSAGWQELYDPCTGVSLDLAFEITTGEYSHPNDILWKYKAYDYDEVLVGYDKHPEDPDPIDPGHEPVFRYSVRIPKKDWFYQEEPNNVYWFGVVAVYDQGTGNYDWGWTNHEHVYNDDAVEGYLEPGGPEEEFIWSWYELYDQTGMSEDMSFILFNGCPCKADVSDTTGFGPPDGKVDIGDLNHTLMAMFAVYPMGDPTGLYTLSPIPPGLECMDVSDTTGFGPPDGKVDIGDLNYVLMAMFTAYPMGDPTGIYSIPCLP